MTLPGSDTRSPRTTIPRRPRISSFPTFPYLSHSTLDMTPGAARTASPLVSSSFPSASISLQPSDHEYALDFATRSWDLATGGLKTLTAKRELPGRSPQMVASAPSVAAGRAQDVTTASVFPYLSYPSFLAPIAFLGTFLALLGGGLILFVLLLVS